MHFWCQTWDVALKWATVVAWAINTGESIIERASFVGYHKIFHNEYKQTGSHNLRQNLNQK